MYIAMSILSVKQKTCRSGWDTEGTEEDDKDEIEELKYQATQLWRSERRAW